MKRFNFLSIVLSAGILMLTESGTVFAATPTSAGEIISLRGAASVAQGGRTLRLYPGASVIVGDELRTGNNARLKLRMLDGTEITLGENTQFIVREYAMQESAGIGIAALELTKGFFRAVTGKLTQLRENSFQVKTPFAIIGVRGTDFWGEQHPHKLRVAMLGGTAVTVSNDYGSVDITEAGFGTEITAARQAPRAPFRWSEEAIKKASATVN